jgi:hypothetical protein
MHSLINTINLLKQAENQATSGQMTKMIAENIFRDLRSYGLRDKDIVAVSSELLGKLTTDIQERGFASVAPKASGMK